MRSVLRIGLVVCFSAAFVACEQPPEEEIKAAEGALSKAKAAEADVYAEEIFRSATNTLKDSKDKVEQGEYKEARAAAIEAEERANQSVSQAETNKAKTRDGAQAIIDSTSPMLAGAREALSAAPRGKGADGDLGQLDADLGEAEASLNSAKGSLENGMFNDALAHAQAAESKLGGVQDAVSTAMQKIEDWKEQNNAWYLR